MSILGIALWGLGNHSKNRLLPALSSFDKLNIIGVCSRSENTVRECANKWNCEGWTNPSEMLLNPKVDIVYIASPIGLHYSMIKKALIAGKHVWCEKPLTNSFEDSKELVTIARNNNRMLVEAFMYLYHPQFERVQSYVNDRKYGKVYSIVCRFGMPPLEKPGFRDNEKLGGGAFWDIASYPVSAVIALFSEKNIKILLSEILKKDNSIVDNAGRVVLRFSDGPLAYLEWGTGVGYKNEIDLWSEKGSFFTDKIFSKPENFKTKYKIRDLKGNESTETGKTSEQFEDMLHFFYNIYNSADLIQQEYEHILDRSRIMDQIFKAAKLSD